MPLKTDGHLLAERYRDSFQATIGSMLEMQVPADGIRISFEDALKAAQKRFSEEHADEIVSIFEQALANKLK